MTGFKYFDKRPVRIPPTISELLTNLSGEQRGAVLNGFANRVKAVTLARRALIDEGVVQRLYNKIKAIEVYATKLMRGEVLVTPAITDDDTGEITKEAVYNKVPTSKGLITAVSKEFSEDFNSAQVEAILTKMVKFSKYNGSANWSYYKKEVTK